MIAVTLVVSLAANFVPPTVIDLYEILALIKPLLAEGELWRLWTVTLVHAPLQQMPLHLVFNLYALYLAGPFVERLYGRMAFLVHLPGVRGGRFARDVRARRRGPAASARRARSSGCSG